MNYYRLLIAGFALSIASCNNGDSEHTDSFVHSRVDSIVGTRMEEINRKAMDDLDQRMTIEVKQKADSIIAARRSGNTTMHIAPAMQHTLP